MRICSCFLKTKGVFALAPWKPVNGVKIAKKDQFALTVLPYYYVNFVIFTFILNRNTGQYLTCLKRIFSSKFKLDFYNFQTLTKNLAGAWHNMIGSLDAKFQDLIYHTLCVGNMGFLPSHSDLHIYPLKHEVFFAKDTQQNITCVPRKSTSSKSTAQITCYQASTRSYGRCSMDP